MGRVPCAWGSYQATEGTEVRPDAPGPPAARTEAVVASKVGRLMVGDKTMQLLKAMRRQLGETSASRSVDAVAAADSLGMSSGTREFDRRLQDLVRAGYLEPDPNSSAPLVQGMYRITFSGIYAADNH